MLANLKDAVEDLFIPHDPLKKMPYGGDVHATERAIAEFLSSENQVRYNGYSMTFSDETSAGLNIAAISIDLIVVDPYFSNIYERERNKFAADGVREFIKPLRDSGYKGIIMGIDDWDRDLRKLYKQYDVVSLRVGAYYRSNVRKALAENLK